MTLTELRQVAAATEERRGWDFSRVCDHRDPVPGTTKRWCGATCGRIAASSTSAPVGANASWAWLLTLALA